ncbi:hypothetical protein AN958_10104 [Leucoagaricus sp. SymC.cos]|nr:hypothetical protein AN958_10104 [Leucoagaricus sp. SymC.cos]
MDQVTELFSRELSGIYEEIKDQVNDPLPQDRNEKAKTRAKLIDIVMGKIQAAYFRVLTQVGVPREQAEVHSESFFSKIKRMLLITANIADRFPLLKEVIVFAASMLLLPQFQILRPIMVFFGFGPTGVVRGTAAAWAQRTFFGGLIPAGSWFAILQRVSMTLTGSWLQKLAASVGLAAFFGFTTGNREEL